MKTKLIYFCCICFAFFVCAVVNATQGSMLTSFIDHYELQSSAQGGPGAAQSFGQAFVLILLFWQAGKVSKPTVVAFSLTGAVVLLLAASFIPPFAVLAALYGLFGVMFGAISSTTSSMVADIFTGDDASKYMSVLHGIFGLGGLVMPLVYMGMFDFGLQWNVIIRITMVVVAAMLVPFFLLSRYSLKHIDLSKSTSKSITLADFKGFFKHGSGLLLILCSFFFGTHQSVVTIWIIRYVSVFLEAPALGALSLSMFWAGVTVSRLFTHKVLPFSPIKIALIGCFASAAVMCAGILSGSAILMTICVFLVGVLSGTTMPVLLAIGCADNLGNTILPTNFLNLAMFLALMVSPLIVGVLDEYASMNVGMYMSAACLLICGVLVFTYSRKTHRI